MSFNWAGPWYVHSCIWSKPIGRILLRFRFFSQCLTKLRKARRRLEEIMLCRIICVFVISFAGINANLCPGGDDDEGMFGNVWDVQLSVDVYRTWVLCIIVWLIILDFGMQKRVFFRLHWCLYRGTYLWLWKRYQILDWTSAMCFTYWIVIHIYISAIYSVSQNKGSPNWWFFLNYL